MKKVIERHKKWINLCDQVSEPYIPMKCGNAEIAKPRFKAGRMDFYFTDEYVIDEFDVAMLNIDGDLAMSITPMELQAHILPIKWAEGDVLVVGLGLGYYLREIVKKPQVDSVLVIEKSEDVIRLFDRQFPDVARHPKVTIVHDDATLNYIDRDEPFDFAYLDIWNDLDFEQILLDIEDTIISFDASMYSFWGMERMIVERMSEGEHFDDICDDIPFYVSRVQRAGIGSLYMELVEDA